ncbi:LPS export ABC transporter periplasmic protein LptC [bacterium]|nr:LPS export ABC transporter periplasmic protein LptC [bacterium]MBU1959513.1 LPS export ABC transporter periplasmic protein LptC [bacterium]
MVLRIEYLLVPTLIILVLSVLGIHPSSQSAVTTTADREILFENFSLFELKENFSEQKLFASKTIKYTNRLDMKDINLTDKNGHNILANEAIYQDDDIYMNENIRLFREDGLTFSTEILNYNLKRKELKTFTPFYLEYNGSTIKGSGLTYSLKGKELYANDIEASIIFIPQSDTIEE